MTIESELKRSNTILEIAAELLASSEQPSFARVLKAQIQRNDAALKERGEYMHYVLIALLWQLQPGQEAQVELQRFDTMGACQAAKVERQPVTAGATLLCKIDIGKE